MLITIFDKGLTERFGFENAAYLAAVEILFIDAPVLAFVVWLIAQILEA